MRRGLQSACPADCRAGKTKDDELAKKEESSQETKEEHKDEKEKDFEQQGQGQITQANEETEKKNSLSEKDKVDSVEEDGVSINSNDPSDIQHNLVDLAMIDSDLIFDVRYSTDNNFTKSIVYQTKSEDKKNQAFLVKNAAIALSKANQELLSEYGYQISPNHPEQLDLQFQM